MADLHRKHIWLVKTALFYHKGALHMLCEDFMWELIPERSTQPAFHKPKLLCLNFFGAT